MRFGDFLNGKSKIFRLICKYTYIHAYLFDFVRMMKDMNKYMPFSQVVLRAGGSEKKIRKNYYYYNLIKIY